ncbi:MAG: hypothetical protein K6A95_08100 [Bacteroidales bacterium]|nr:hypothetical protein [Bacteroidales bacterium]
MKWKIGRIHHHTLDAGEDLFGHRSVPFKGFLLFSAEVKLRFSPLSSSLMNFLCLSNHLFYL